MQYKQQIYWVTVFHFVHEGKFLNGGGVTYSYAKPVVISVNLCMRGSYIRTLLIVLNTNQLLVTSHCNEPIIKRLITNRLVVSTRFLRQNAR